MRSLNLNYLKEISLKLIQGTTLKKIGEFQGKQALFARQTPEILESLKQVAQIESSESSNRIEGVTARPGRVKALVMESTEPQDRPEQEIAGYRDALELVHESAEYMAFSRMSIKQMHSTMYRYMPDTGGQWKTRDNKIIEITDKGHEVRFEPVSAKKTPEAVETLARNFDQAINQHQQEPLIVIPLAILDFLCMRQYSRSSRQVFSVDRWACVGDAAVFSDPFYAPAVDLIALGNLFTAEMIRLDLEGKLTPGLVRHYDQSVLSFVGDLGPTQQAEERPFGIKEAIEI